MHIVEYHRQDVVQIGENLFRGVSINVSFEAQDAEYDG